MSARRPRVVVRHLVLPEVPVDLGEFRDLLRPTRQEGVWPRPKAAELAADADGLIVWMADSIDDAFLAGCRRLR